MKKAALFFDWFSGFLSSEMRDLFGVKDSEKVLLTESKSDPPRRTQKVDGDLIAVLDEIYSNELDEDVQRQKERKVRNSKNGGGRRCEKGGAVAKIKRKRFSNKNDR
jgi:hypothetical protein